MCVRIVSDIASDHMVHLFVLHDDVSLQYFMPAVSSWSADVPLCSLHLVITSNKWTSVLAKSVLHKNNNNKLSCTKVVTSKVWTIFQPSLKAEQPVTSQWLSWLDMSCGICVPDLNFLQLFIYELSGRQTSIGTNIKSGVGRLFSLLAMWNVLAVSNVPHSTKNYMYFIK